MTFSVPDMSTNLEFFKKQFERLSKVLDWLVDCLEEMDTTDST